MAVLAGNLTTLSITVADLKQWIPSLDKYMPEGQPDWSGQIAAGKDHALEHAHSSTGHDPAWLKPVNVAHWKRVLVAATLFIIFDAMQTDPWKELSEKWEKRFIDWFARGRFEHDEDQDGTIDPNVDEAGRPPREIELVRG